MNTDYRKHAETLVADVADLQKQVLVKHTKALLEEIHDELRSAKQDKTLAESFADDYRRERDQCVEALRIIYAERGEDARISELCNGILDRFSSSG